LQASSTNHTLGLGNGAGSGFTSSANYSIAIGESALGNATTSPYNIAIGYQAGQNVLWDSSAQVDHTSNIAIGYQALTGSGSTLASAGNNSSATSRRVAKTLPLEEDPFKALLQEITTSRLVLGTIIVLEHCPRIRPVE
jgi:hypothetical protein